jgi:polyhydroxybutyrate depolymerase
VPILHVHGTADPIVPYLGGTPILPQLGSLFRSVDETMTFWRTHNVCSANQQVFFQNGDATCVKWPDCAAGADTLLCTIDGGGHTWPGGLEIPVAGKTSHDLSANATMIGFFETHPLP